MTLAASVVDVKTVQHAPQDMIVCLFLASNIYAVEKCRWFSPSIVILGAFLFALRQRQF